MNAIIAALLVYIVLLILLLAVIFIVLWRLIMDLTDKINELALLMQGHRADTEQAGHELNEKQQQLEKKLTELSASLEHLVDTLRAVFGKSTAPSKPLSRKNTKEK